MTHSDWSRDSQVRTDCSRGTRLVYFDIERHLAQHPSVARVVVLLLFIRSTTGRWPFLSEQDFRGFSRLDNKTRSNTFSSIKPDFNDDSSFPITAVAFF